MKRVAQGESIPSGHLLTMGAVVNKTPNGTLWGFVISVVFSMYYASSLVLLGSQVRNINLGCRVQSPGCARHPKFLFTNSPILRFTSRVV